MIYEGEGLAALSIALVTLVSEDAAVIGAGVLASVEKIQWTTAFIGGFLGVWLGDIGLYALARIFGRGLVDRLLRNRARAEERLRNSQAWFERHGWFALILCRAVPGTRLPTYLTAGLLCMPVWRFVAITGVVAFIWVGVLLVVVAKIGASAPMWLEMQRLPLALVGASLLGLVLVWWQRRNIGAWLNRFPAFARCLQWEFWPAAIFYFPIAIWYVLLALRHRSATLPTCANPGMFTGGIIGESKIATLLDLERSSPDWVAAGFLIPVGPIDERMSTLTAGMAARQLDYPIVLKPDVGQRGSGFRLIRSAETAVQCLLHADEPMIAQEYLPGPHEAGVFYYRFPEQEHGRIFSITQKVFPCLTGDGQRSLEALILADPRARLMAGVYLQRHAAQRARIPAAGEMVRLVEAGNHAQGCIFEDGKDAITPELEARMDVISRGLEGFFIGRYDVRFADSAAFARGEGFKILELNGAASESTNAYAASHSLFKAYAVLFEQWRLVFAIGAANRKRGHRPTSWKILLTEWRAYRKCSSRRSIAD